MEYITCRCKKKNKQFSQIIDRIYESYDNQN
jgi:hypothetical protein